MNMKQFQAEFNTCINGSICDYIDQMNNCCKFCDMTDSVKIRTIVQFFISIQSSKFQ